MTSAPGFIPGMRAHGECPHHPGQPFYHCADCAKDRRQVVGDKILQEIADSAAVGGSEQSGLIANPSPVEIKPRALSALLSHVRSFLRQHPAGLATELRNRLAGVTGPEAEAVEAQLAPLKDIQSVQIVLLVFIDPLAESGVRPAIKLSEPSTVAAYAADYVEFVYPAGLIVAVEKKNLNYLRGLVIDWQDRLDSSGFCLLHKAAGA